MHWGIADVHRGIADVQEGIADVDEGISDVQQGISGVQQGISGVQQGISGVQQGISGVEEGIFDVQWGSDEVRRARPVPRAIGSVKIYRPIMPIVRSHVSTSCGHPMMGDSVGRSPNACPPFTYTCNSAGTPAFLSAA